MLPQRRGSEWDCQIIRWIEVLAIGIRCGEKRIFDCLSRSYRNASSMCSS